MREWKRVREVEERGRESHRREKKQRRKSEGDGGEG